MNLSHAADTSEESEFRSRTGIEPPTFAAGPVLGNIGGPLRTLPDDLDDDDALEVRDVLGGVIEEAGTSDGAVRHGVQIAV